MTLFLSHRIERLVDLLAEQLVKESSPCSESWVLLPGSVNKQWLMVNLTERLPGHAIAGIRFLSWREALLLACHAKDHVINSFELQLALTKILSDETTDELASWLKECNPNRLTLFVRRLSEQMMEAGFYAMEPQENWHRNLLEKLTDAGPWRFLAQILPEAFLPPSVGHVHCFCVDEMPEAGWDFFLRSSSKVYLFSPCRMFWDDTVSDGERRKMGRRLRKEGLSPSSIEAFENYLRDTHPLLANWGRLGRETIRRLDARSLPTQEAYEGSEESLEDAHEKFRTNRFSLLEMIQNDLLFLRTPDDAVSEKSRHDSSISIHAAGSSRLREVQILRDQILHQIQDAKEPIGYSDILVLAPDIRPYEPLIQFVFGADLPIRIAPVALLPRSPALQSILLFFALLDRNWEADALMELFENRSFQAKHQLTTEELEKFRTWLKEAKVRGGWDKSKGGWPDGMQRMLSGLIYLLPDEDPLPRIRSMDWGGANLLDRLLGLIRELCKIAEFFSTGPCTLEEWAQHLKTLVAFLIDDRSPEEVLSAFVRKLGSASEHFTHDRFASTLIRSNLENDCRRATAVHQAFSVESIQFSSLQPGAIRPARAIFLLGLDSESFPRLEVRSTLDWPHAKPDSVDQDHYLLLQALFAAQEHLSISYCHLSPEDGKLVEPALPVQELMQVIDTLYPLKGIKASSALMTIHPTLPTDNRYFQPDSPWRSFSHEAFQAANASPLPPAVFWPSGKKKAPIRQLDFDDLALLARHPWKYFLQKKLGIYLKDEKLFSEMRLGDFVLPAYEEQRLLKRSLREPIDQVMAQNQELPPGTFGAWAEVQLKQKAREWDAHLCKWGIDRRDIYSVRFSKKNSSRSQNSNRIEAPPIVVSIENESIEITGEIDLVTPVGLLSANEPNFFDALRHWPALLAFQTLFPASPALHWLKKGTSKTWPIDATDGWRRYIEYALKAQESLSPLIAPWADAFLHHNEEEWKEEARHSLLKAEEPAILWVLARSQPLPLERIWEEWSGFLSTTFSDLIREDDHAAV